MYDKYTPVCNYGSFSLLICLDAYRLNGVVSNCVSPLLLNSHVQQVHSCLLLKRRIGNGNRPNCHSERKRGNPLNRNANTVAIAESLASFRNHYRAENLCYQFEQGQKLLSQFRKIVCLVYSVLRTQADKRTLKNQQYKKRAVACFLYCLLDFKITCSF